METKKYELLKNDTIEISGHTLYCIKALKSFGHVKEGDLGGYIEKEDNLSHYGKCWVYNHSYVYGNAKVCDNALIMYAMVYGNAKIYDDAILHGSANCVKIYDNAEILDTAYIGGNAEIYGNARIGGQSYVSCIAKIFGDAVVLDKAQISDNVEIYDSAYIGCNAIIQGSAKVFGNARIKNATICQNSQITGDITVSCDAIICNNARISTRKDFTVISNLGIKDCSNTFFKNIDGTIMVKCGCFNDTLGAFESFVKTYRDESIKKEYLLTIDYIRNLME